MKYIIKNCPCYCEGTVIQGNEQLTQACQSLHRVIKEGKIGLEKCCDIDDCVIKQIVELCEEELKPVYIRDLTGASTPCYKGGYNLAQDILKLLEIEEQ